MAIRSRAERDAEFEAFNEAASVWDERAERDVFNAMMSETGERRQYNIGRDRAEQRKIMQESMKAEFNRPNPILQAILNSKKPLEFDDFTQELVIDGKRIASAELESSGARKVMEKVYQDAVMYGVGTVYVGPDGVIEEPEQKKPKKTTLLDYVELDL